MQANPGTTLENAYRNAVWADPELQQDLLKSEREKAAKEAKDELEKARKKEVEKAKQSTTKLKGKGTGVDVEPTKKEKANSQRSY